MDMACLNVSQPSEMDNYILPSTAVVAALAVSTLLFRRTSGNGHDKKLPPGPPPTSLWGTLSRCRRQGLGLTSKIWGNYMVRSSKLCTRQSSNLTNLFSGPIIHLSLGGNRVLVLNDAKDADELVSPTRTCICTQSSCYMLQNNPLPAEPTLEQLFVAKTAHLRRKVPIER